MNEKNMYQMRRKGANIKDAKKVEQSRDIWYENKR